MVPETYSTSYLTAAVMPSELMEIGGTRRCICISNETDVSRVVTRILTGKIFGNLRENLHAVIIPPNELQPDRTSREFGIFAQDVGANSRGPNGWHREFAMVRAALPRIPRYWHVQRRRGVQLKLERFGHTIPNRLKASQKSITPFRSYPRNPGPRPHGTHKR